MDTTDLVPEDVCKSLESNSKAHRISALRWLQGFCESPENSTDGIISVYEKCYLHILKCYSDKFESCRELACLVIDEFMKKLPNNDYYMHYVVSTIVKQIGQEELTEESEELRLVMVSQLMQLINKFGDPVASKDPLLKSYNDIVDVLRRRLLDKCPAVQKESCNCVKAFAEKSPSFHYRAEVFSTPLFSVVHHKHFLNRVAGIETLAVVALHISNGDCISKIITEVSPMLMDPVPAVRRQCGRFGCKLMLELRDRYSFFEKLIPLVLCCLSDESEEVQKEIEQLWLKCGQLYFEENEAELNKLEIVDNIPENYPKDVRRPTIGCRALVQRCLRVVKLIMRETSDWKQSVRLHSLKLLWQFVLHTEITITPKFMEIISELARACRDPESDVAKKALEVGNLLGCLLSYEDWFPHAFEMLESHPNLGYLKCFYSIYSMSKECNSKDIISLASLLSKESFTHNIDEDFQIHLVKLAIVLWDRKTSGDNSLEAQIDDISLSDKITVQENLYIIAVKVMSLCNENTNSNALKWTEDLLALLAKEREIDDLHQNYLASVLRSINLDFEMDDSCELIEILDGVIRCCGFRRSAMDEYKRCIKSVWAHGTSEAKIKIMSAISLAMLSWDKTLGLSGEQNLDLLQAFINDTVVQHLEWRSGCTAESLRSLATATLCAMCEGASEGHVILQGNLKYFPDLIQDNCVSTRIYTLRALYRSTALKFQDYKQILNAVLQRLDDPSYEVRKWAAIVLGKLQLNDSQNNYQDVKKLVENTLSVLRLHCDSPEPKLKEAIESSVRAIGEQFPELNQAPVPQE